MSRKRHSRRRKASQRRSELIRICRHRRSHGGRCDPRVWLFVFAQTLGSAPAGPIGAGRGFQWFGLDVIEMRKMIRDSDLGVFTDDEIGETMSTISPNCPLISAAKLGEMIQLTVEERQGLDIRGIDAVGQSKAQRDEAAALLKRERDAARQRLARAKIRAVNVAIGRARSRDQVRADAEAIKLEAAALGVSVDAVYKRRQRAKADMSKVPSTGGAASMSKAPSPHLYSLPARGRDFGQVESAHRQADVEHVPGLSKGLAEGSLPFSGASKKETERLGRPIQEEESPRDVASELLEAMGDSKLAACVMEEIGDSHEEVVRRFWLLRPDYFGRMAEKIRQAGGVSNINEVYRLMGLARATAMGIEQAPRAEGAVG